MSAEVKKMLSQEETGGSKIELRTSSGTVICLNFEEKLQILPKIIRLVDSDTDDTVVFRSEDGVYHELDSDSAANLQEFEASNEEDENYNGHCHQILQLPIRGLKQNVLVNSSQMKGEHKTSPSKDGKNVSEEPNIHKEPDLLASNSQGESKWSETVMFEW